MPPIISFVGRPGSGKTTLLERLIPQLVARGCRVGVIKHHVHAFTMDQPGKDTWRLKKAGAQAVALSSPTGLGIIRDVDVDSDLPELGARYFFDMDLLLTEGYKRQDQPKVEVFRRAVHERPLGDELTNLVAMVTDVALPCAVPQFGFDALADLVDFLVRFIEAAQGNKRP